MIYLNNEKKINELKEKMNINSICVFLDFDKTITTGDSQDSWDASANIEVFGKELLNRLGKYYEKYGPIELDYTIDIKEKEKYMEEWYAKCMDLYYAYHPTKEKLKKSIDNSKLTLREGVQDFLLKLYKGNVPVIILSAGIGNVIKQFLKEKGCDYDNITVISNFIKFDEKGNMKKFSDNLIHTLNKNIDKLGIIEIKEKIKTKEYRIVIGDLIEDIYMVGDYPVNQLLKIGFLNKNITKNLAVYNENFDIVLTEGNNFYDIENHINC